MVRVIPHEPAVVLLLASSAFLSCGGSAHSIPPANTPNMAGPWEFIAISQSGTNTGDVTGIEVSLSEGQTIVNGFPQPNGQITANSNQMTFVSLSPTTLNATGFAAPCQSVMGDNALNGSVTSADAPVQFTFTENGNVFTVNGTLSGDGKSLLNGTYSAQSGNTCTADSGGSITGTFASKITGNFYGTICVLGDTSSSCQQTDNASAAASESGSSILTLSLTLSGTDNTNLTLSGPVTGNAFVLQGTVQGQAVTYDGYYEAINGVGSIYLVNATNAAAPNYVGTLTIPH